MNLFLLTLLSCASPTPSPLPEPIDVPVATASIAVAPAPHPHAAALALLPDDQAAIIVHATSGLDELCTQSLRARDLRQFYLNNGVEAELLGHEQIRMYTAPSVQYPFLVIGDSNPDSSVGTGSFIGAHFVNNPSLPAPVMELKSIGMTSLGAGIMLAHELVHAQEFFLHNEPLSEFPDPNWIIGETIAHSVVSTVLNEYSMGAWKAYINLRVARMTEFLASQQMDPDAPVFGYTDDDARFVKATFPGSDNATIGVLLMQLDVDTSIERVRRMAEQRKLNRDERDAAMIYTMTRLYENMNYKDAR